MEKIKILTVFGTRPEAIKMCPLILEFSKHKNIESIVAITAQHREMLDQVLNVFNVQIDFDLDIMKDKQSLPQITTKVLFGMSEIIKKVCPDIVLVHGDTTTAFSTALAAFYEKVTIGHVEAGLRTYNKYSPFPEEINRQLISDIADLHFAPTNNSKKSLLREYKNEKNIFVTGNTVIDAIQTTVTTSYYHELFEWLDNSKLILITVHRRENIGEPMENIFSAIKQILIDYPEYKAIYPVHKNPLVRSIAYKVFDNLENIKIVEPLEVIDFHNFLNRSHIILTDSGGIQEEAPSLGIPVIVLRDTTERPEGIEAGTLKLAGTSYKSVYDNIRILITDPDLYNKMSIAHNPYGDGTASIQITDAIINFFQKGDR